MQALALLSQHQLDQSIYDALPEGKVIEVLRHDREPWSRGYKVILESLGEHKVKKYYFLRINEGENHEQVARSEYECHSALSRYIPTAVNRPEGYGTLESDPDKSFFLTLFRDTDDKHDLNRPNVNEVSELLFSLCRNGVSPWNRGFGFPFDTFNARNLQPNNWSHDWTYFFSRMLRHDIRMVIEQTRCPGQELEEFEQLAMHLVDKVVPRLLDPLQSEGRKIKPIMVIGDLQYGDLQRNRTDGRIGFSYPGACYFAHHEIGLVKMLNAWAPVDAYQKFVLVHIYKGRVGFSEPVCDYEDRLVLYALKTRMIASVEDASQRSWLIEGMRYLVDKYSTLTE